MTPQASSASARLLIADDHELSRSGLRAMLGGEPDLAVVAEAHDGREALELCRAHRPDLALLDVRMPQLDGLTATRAIRTVSPSTSVIIVTMHDSPDYLEAAIAAGAAGYVLKEATRGEILHAVRSVLRGDTFLNGSVVTRLLRRLSCVPDVSRGRGSRPSGPSSTAERLQHVLTPREGEVLRGVTRGQTNKEIGRHLGISPGTAKVHVERIIAKLGVADRTQAAVRAVEAGLIRPATEDDA